VRFSIRNFKAGSPALPFEELSFLHKFKIRLLRVTVFNPSEPLSLVPEGALAASDLVFEAGKITQHELVWPPLREFWADDRGAPRLPALWGSRGATVRVVLEVDP
jgi:hypothetical protein